MRLALSIPVFTIGYFLYTLGLKMGGFKIDVDACVLFHTQTGAWHSSTFPGGQRAWADNPDELFATLNWNVNLAMEKARDRQRQREGAQTHAGGNEG